MSQVFSEPHSTKQREDGVGWGLETDAETLLRTAPASHAPDGRGRRGDLPAVRCPVLVVHGDEDAIVPYATGVALAEWTGGELVTLRHGGGHAPPMREPVAVNLLVREFAESGGRPPRAGAQAVDAGRWTAAAARCSSARRSGSATSAVTWPSPPSCARCTRTWRSTG